MSEPQINNAFFEELGRSPKVTQLCVDVAEKIASAARASAPRDTDTYADSIRVEVVSRAHRNAALVVAHDRKSLIIESKTGNLARALNQVKKSG